MKSGKRTSPAHRPAKASHSASAPALAKSISGRVLACIGFLCAVPILLEFTMTRHPHFPGEGRFAFYTGLGLVASLLVAGGGWLLKFFLARPGDYYDR